MIHIQVKLILEALEKGDIDEAKSRAKLILQQEEVETFPSPETATAARCTTQTKEFHDHARKMALAAIADAPDCYAVKGGVWPLDDAPRYLLADRLKRWLEEMHEIMELRPRWAKPDVAQLVLAVGSLGRVDFDALARYWLAVALEV